MTKEFWKNWFESQEEWFYNNFRRKYAIREALEKIDNPVDDLGLANGCSKLCIIDHKAGFVLKWSTDLNYNEMAKEYKYYQKAVECGIECFFPKTEILTEVNGITIFVQEKVDTLLHDMNYRKRETLRNKHQKTVKVSSTTIRLLSLNILKSRSTQLFLLKKLKIPMLQFLLTTATMITLKQLLIFKPSSTTTSTIPSKLAQI